MENTLLKNLINMGNKDDPNYDEIMNKFIIQCPVNKINLKLEHPNAIAGMYVLASDEAYKRFESKAMLNDLDENTLLFFSDRHIAEMCEFMHGMCSLLIMNKLMKESEEISSVRNFINICKGAPRYGNYLHTVESDNYGINKAMTKFGDILKKLPFISYAEIDNLAADGIENFKKNGGNNNESKD